MSANPSSSVCLPIVSGHACEQGIRPTMEDEVLIRESFHIPSRGHFSFFGVFDGHGGRNAAIFTRDHLFEYLRAELESGADLGEALTRAYLKTDQQFIAACRGHTNNHLTPAHAAIPAPIPAPVAASSNNLPPTTTNIANSSTLLPAPTPHRRQQSANLAVKIPITSLPPQASQSRSTSAIVGHPDLSEKDTSGTTAVSVLIHHESYQMVVANCGDSRAVLAGSNGSVISLTNDHKADRPDEVDRIRRAGGFVVHKRVMGELAISRAIGDMDFKETGFLFVLADPELCTHQLTEKDEFVLLACDGIYDVMSNEQACAYVRESLKAGNSIQSTAERLVRHSIDTLNTRDNVTVVLVKLPTSDQLRAAGIETPSTPIAGSNMHAHFHDSHVMTPQATPTPNPNSSANATTSTQPPSNQTMNASNTSTAASVISPSLNASSTTPHHSYPLINLSQPQLVASPHPVTLPPQSHIVSPHHLSTRDMFDGGIKFHSDDDHEMTPVAASNGFDTDAGESKQPSNSGHTHTRTKSDEKELMHQANQTEPLR